METKKNVSGNRLRIGVLLIFLFWIPVWLLGPLLASLDGQSIDNATILIMIIQGILGLFGVILCGKPIYYIIKATPRRKIFKTIWHVFKTGQYE